MIEIEQIKDLLKSTRRLFGWNIRNTHQEAYELYFIRQELDMNRKINSNDLVVTIFVKNEDGMNKSSFTVYPSMDIDDVKDLLNEHIGICRLSSNKEYMLPRKEQLKPVLNAYGFDNQSDKDIAFLVADALFEGDKFDNGYINSSEIFIRQKQTQYYDSNDNYYVYTSRTGEVEFIATWVDEKADKEYELYKNFEFNSLNTKEIQDIANDVLFQAGERSKAIKMPQVDKIKLLLTGDSVKDYFFNLAKLTKCDNIYEKTSKVSVGDDLYNGNAKGDRVSIRLEPTLKNSTRGMNFDEEGVALRRLVTIDKGIVKNLWGSNDKSQYLHKPVHGNYKNIVVEAGTLNDDELEDENYLEVVSFSDFYIDFVTGDFGSEIRLAYLHLKNKDKQIVTGGSVAGNIYDSLENVRFSKEVISNNNYVGPKTVLLDKIRVNKGE